MVEKARFFIFANSQGSFNPFTVNTTHSSVQKEFFQAGPRIAFIALQKRLPRRSHESIESAESWNDVSCLSELGARDGSAFDPQFPARGSFGHASFGTLFSHAFGTSSELEKFAALDDGRRPDIKLSLLRAHARSIEASELPVNMEKSLALRGRRRSFGGRSSFFDEKAWATAVEKSASHGFIDCCLVHTRIPCGRVSLHTNEKPCSTGLIAEWLS